MEPGVVVADVELGAPARWNAPPGNEEGMFQECLELCGRCGLELDPWQQFVLRRGLRLRPDGKFAAPEVGVCVGRQNGKGGIIEARELGGLFVWGETTIVHTAHLFDTSLEAFLRMSNLIEEGGLQMELKPRGGINLSHGSEGFVTRGGRRLKYRSRTKGGGRGFTGDCLINDEAMTLPETFHNATFPIQSARSVQGNPQTWYFGSAVDQISMPDGIVFARVRHRGLSGDPNLAWFEWSGTDDPELTPARADDLLDDREAWRRANPALGIRISEEWVAIERETLGPRGFLVERLGVGDWPKIDQSGGGKVTLESWLKLADPESRLAGSLVLAFDVSPNRTSGCIAAGGLASDGSRVHLEVIEHRAGVKWLVPRLKELVLKHRPEQVICDGPARSKVTELEQAGIEVHEMTGTEYGEACGQFVDEVAAAEVVHLGTGELTAALRGADTAPLGDAWKWSRRKSESDITPLVAVTLALWGAKQLEGGDYVTDPSQYWQ